VVATEHGADLARAEGRIVQMDLVDEAAEFYSPVP
jgi:hypothetical protein